MQQQVQQLFVVRFGFVAKHRAASYFAMTKIVMSVKIVVPIIHLPNTSEIGQIKRGKR
jgi:hypothetical protein